MKVKIGVEFEVDTDDEQVARAAASLAAWNYLAFVKINGYTPNTETVEVHVDGYGPVEVRLGEDHD